MLGPHWRDRIPEGSWLNAAKFLDSLSWNLSWRKEDGVWRLYAGDPLLFSAESERELEAFVLGMALGLAVLPENMLEHIRKLVAE